MDSDSLILWTVLHLVAFFAVGAIWLWPRKPVQAAAGSVPARSPDFDSGQRQASPSEPLVGEDPDGRIEGDGTRSGSVATAATGPGLETEIALPSKEALAGRRSLTSGPGFDIRQIDPDSVELSADEMLNPLQSIVQLVEKIRDEGDLSSNQRRYLGAALAKSRRMIAHIEDIDLMMRLQQGNVSLRERSFSLSEKLAKLAEAASRSTRDRGILVQFHDLDERPFLVSVDEQLIEKLLGQLMNASLKVTVPGGMIEVRLSSSEVETAVSGSEFFFLEEEEYAVQEQRKIELVFSLPRIPEDDRLSYLTHAVAENPESALALKRFGQPGEVGQDLFGLTLARNIARKLGAELLFEPDRQGRTEFVLTMEAECLAMDPGRDRLPGDAG